MIFRPVEKSQTRDASTADPHDMSFFSDFAFLPRTGTCVPHDPFEGNTISSFAVWSAMCFVYLLFDQGWYGLR